MADYLNKRPMLLCALIASALCIVGFYSQSAVFFCGLALTVLFFIALYHRCNPSLLAVLLLSPCVAVSVLLNSLNIRAAEGAADTPVHGFFTVAAEPENHGVGESAVLEVIDCDGLKKGTRLQLYYYADDICDISYGDRIEAELELSEMSDKYKKSFYSEGIYLYAYPRSAETVGRDPVLKAAGSVRNYIRGILFSSMDYDEAATLTAITIGDRSFFSDKFYSNVKSAGVSHIMVVSGMHLSVIVALTACAVKKFFYNKYLRVMIMLATVLFMSAVCGFTKSVLRAGFCSLFLGLGILLERENTAENSLGSAAVLLYLVSPCTIFSISFQLSILSTLGIVAVAMPCLAYINENRLIKSRALFTVASAVTVTLSATLFTMPVSIYTFGYISLVSVPVNLLIGAVSGIALQLSVIGLLLSLIPISFNPVLCAAEFSASYMNGVINRFGGLPFATANVGTAEFWASLGALAGVICLLLFFSKRIERGRLKALYAKITKEGGRKLKWQ